MSMLRPVDGSPCRDCPFRRDVKPGIWPPAVYRRIQGYDGNLAQQNTAGARQCMFCPNTPKRLCGGWVSVFPLRTSLALQLAVPRGLVDVAAVRTYRPGVPLFASGAEAAAHGMKGTGVLLEREKAAEQCYCGHRRFSHSSEGQCAFCSGCLMFKLDDPARRRVNVDALAEEIVAAVARWAKDNPARFDEAAKILSVSPALGPLPPVGSSYVFLWRCETCGECPLYRYDPAAYKCKCGHGPGEHSPANPTESRKAHDRQVQPA